MIEDRPQQLRIAEAILFATSAPVTEAAIASRLPEGADVKAILAEIAKRYEDRGVNLTRVANGWAFRTSPDLSFLLQHEATVQRRLSKAAVETLAIIAYHQPVTRAEIEDTRGVGLSRGTLDLLLEAGWIRPLGRKRTPGRPVTYGTTDAFLDHFGLANVDDLPGVQELKAAGLMEADEGMPLFPAAAPDADDADEEAPSGEEEGSSDGTELAEQDPSSADTG